jgi:hypothetical protein
MARRTRTKKASGGVKANLSGPTTPEQPQVVALARDPGTGDPEEPKTMAAMALSGPTSPEQPQ